MIRTVVLALLLVASGVAQAGAPAPPPADAFIALCYHDVRDQVDGDMDADPMAISSAHLLQQFEWLRQNGYHPVSLDEIAAARSGARPLPSKAVLLTFDDGYTSFYERVYPLLQLYHYPALLAVVGKWLQSAGDSMVSYGDSTRFRGDFLTWQQIREMEASSLVEVASHTYNLHRGIPANPQGNTQAAAVTREYYPKTGHYESVRHWRMRVRRDLERNSALIKKHTGRTPRAIVWPYGRHNAFGDAIARKLGMTFIFTLDDGIDRAGQKRPYGRTLMVRNPDLANFVTQFQPQRPEPRRVVQVDLDYVYDPDPKRQETNLSRLLDRIKAMRVNTVYLQAFADPAGDGNAHALYFPNRHMPMRADLFNRVAWQLQTRANVDVYAWLPISSFILPGNHDALLVHTQTDHGIVPTPNNYQRLSVFSPKARRIIEDIYTDLATHAAFRGILFHDDGFLSDYEDLGKPALKYYRRHGLDLGDPAAVRADPTKLARWTAMKTRALNDFTSQLAAGVRQYRPEIKTARNIYTRPILDPRARNWFAEDLASFTSHYDYTAVMAMPWMEGAKHPMHWLRQLVNSVRGQAPLDKVVFELQSVDWRTGEPIDATLMVQQMQMLQREGAVNFGYYPDHFLDNRPDLETIKQGISLEDYPYRRR